MPRPVTQGPPAIVKPKIRHLDDLPNYFGEDYKKSGASGAPSGPPDDRTEDTGAVKADPWIPVGYGRVRVVGQTFFGFPGDWATAWFGESLMEGPIDSIEKVYLNGAQLPGSGAFADRDTNRWYFDQWIGDGSLRFTGVGPLSGVQILNDTAKTCAHSVLYFFGPTWGGGWPANWGHGSSDMIWNFAFQVKAKVCYDPRSATWAWTQNPILQIRDLLTTLGRRDPSEIDDASFSAAATASDTAGFTCDILFAQRIKLGDAIAQIAATCNAELTPIGGKIGIILDQAQAGAASFTFTEGVNLMEPQHSQLKASQRPTRVTVKFPNAANNYRWDTESVDDPGLAGGSVLLREKVVELKGVTTNEAAHKIATRILNTETVLDRMRATIGWEGILLSRYTKIRVKTDDGLDRDDLVMECNETSLGIFEIVTKPYVSGVYSDTPITPTPPTSGPPVPAGAPNDVTVTDVSQELEVLSSSDATHDRYDIFQLIEYVQPARAWTVDHLVVRGSDAADSQTKAWADLAASEITIGLGGNETQTDDEHKNLRHTLVKKATRVITYTVRPTVSTDVRTENDTRIIIRSVSTTGDLSTGVTVDFTAGVGPTISTPGKGLASPLIVDPSGTQSGQGGEIQLRELAANGTNSTGFVAPNSLAGDLRYVLPSVAPTDGQMLVFDATAAGYPAWARVLKWAGGEWVWAMQSSGTVNGSTTVFQVPYDYVPGTLVVFKDGQVCVDSSFSPVAGHDYTVSGRNVTFIIAPGSWVGFLFQRKA